VSGPAADIQQHPFSRVSGIEPDGRGRFLGNVNPEWTIGGKPNGGYLLAMLGRAASQTSTHHHVIAASAHYLRTPDSGAVTIDAEVLREGRNASQVRARMSQHEKVCVETLMTVSTLERQGAPYWDAGLPPRSDVDYDDCVRLTPRTPDGIPVAIMEQVDVRLEPSSTGFMAGRPTGHGELRGWLTLLHEEPFDPTSLLFAVDAFPPATFDIEFAGWVPTLELTVYVRALPAPGPVRVLQRAQLIDGQRVDETCFIWDTSGRLVAHGSQLAGIRLG
jgi:acyl-coenzyme A thioesterase PaaI-like protein